MMEEALAKKANVLRKLSIVSSSQQDHDAALGYAESALEIYEKLGDKQNIFRMHGLIHLLYMSGAWDGAREDKALKHLEAIAALVEKDPDDMEKGAVYQRTAHLYLHRGQPNTALAWAQNAVDLFARLGVPMGTRLKAASSLAGNIRDAAITVQGGGQRAEKRNTGFVPLINFLIDWRFSRPWSFRSAGDALAGPQGRAEDVLFGVLYDLNASTKILAGYRVLEGGADTTDVYTFSLFHFAVAGIEVRF